MYKLNDNDLVIIIQTNTANLYNLLIVPFLWYVVINNKN